MATAHSSVSGSASVSQDILKKVQSLAAKADYETPKVVSYPVDNLKALDSIAFAGNT